MAKLLLPLLALLFVASCSKDSNDAIPIATVQYKVNGNAVTITSAANESTRFDKLLTGYAAPYFPAYKLYASKGPLHSLGLFILSDSLQIGNYVYDSTVTRQSALGVSAVVTYNDEHSFLLWSGDYIDINITEYIDGLISGNFTAKLSPEVWANGSLVPFNIGTTLITEGLFKNIPCEYH